jgi:hypothetical protein
LVAKASDFYDFIELTLRECASSKHKARGQYQGCNESFHISPKC